MELKNDLFVEATPESLGISSADISNFIDDLERYGFYTHSFLIMRHNKLAAEGYYAPFKKDELHRAYSISKTFTATAIGFLADEGKISLDDPVCKYFPEYCPENMHRYLKEAKIRDLLMMATPHLGGAYTGAKEEKNWAELFFTKEPDHPSGTVFRYDTAGTHVLGSLVEKLSGKPLVEYLKDKGLRDLGFSEDAWCIKAPEGTSWGGSGVMCSTRDLARLGLLYLNKGNIGGKQYLSEEYIKAATSKQIDNLAYGHEKDYYHGYGYKIWITRDDSFTFWGMGTQYVICVPKKDFMFVCNSDNQGNGLAEDIMYEILWNNIVKKLSDTPLDEDKDANACLKEKLANLELHKPRGEVSSKIAKEISGVTYNLNDNPMQISKMKLELLDDCGKFIYDTPRGEKEIVFGLGKYLIGEFPETHYSGDTINTPANRGYRYAACGTWTQEDKLAIKVNVIDWHFGNLNITFSFKGDDICVFMFKVAEWFLNEYNGFASGEKADR